jgi:hypothetical protein
MKTLTERISYSKISIKYFYYLLFSAFVDYVVYIPRDGYPYDI